jgi:hypothetical protein
MMTTVEAARKTLNDLQTKLADTRQWQIEIETATKATAFEAHVDGGDARSKLDNLDSQAIAAGREISSLETAIGEARVRLAAAQAAELDAEERAKATRALALLDGFATRGDALQQSLDKFLSQYGELSSDFHELDKLGYPPTTWALVKVNMQAAVATSLQFTDLRQEFLAPHARRTFGAVISSWASHVRARAEARLNRDAPAKDAADKAA